MALYLTLQVAQLFAFVEPVLLKSRLDQINESHIHRADGVGLLVKRLADDRYKFCKQALLICRLRCVEFFLPPRGVGCFVLLTFQLLLEAAEH